MKTFLKSIQFVAIIFYMPIDTPGQKLAIIYLEVLVRL